MSSNEKWGQRSLLALLPLRVPVSAQQTKGPNLNHVSPLLSALFSPTFFWLWSGIIGLRSVWNSSRTLALHKCTSSLRGVKNKRCTLCSFLFQSSKGHTAGSAFFPYKAQLGRAMTAARLCSGSTLKNKSLQFTRWLLLRRKSSILWTYTIMPQHTFSLLSPCWQRFERKIHDLKMPERDLNQEPLFAKWLQNTKHQTQVSAATTAEPVKESFLLEEI